MFSHTNYKNLNKLYQKSLFWKTDCTNQLYEKNHDEAYLSNIFLLELNLLL